MTTADTLRAAAARLREVAEAATPGPWFEDDLYQTVTGSGFTSARDAYDRDREVNSDVWVIPESMDSGVSGPNLTYIATMSPPVAFALADWLDDIASVWSGDVHDLDGDPLDFAEAVDSHALEVATAVLAPTDPAVSRVRDHMNKES